MPQFPHRSRKSDKNFQSNYIFWTKIGKIQWLTIIAIDDPNILYWNNIIQVHSNTSNIEKPFPNMNMNANVWHHCQCPPPLLLQCINSVYFHWHDKVQNIYTQSKFNINLIEKPCRLGAQLKVKYWKIENSHFILTHVWNRATGILCTLSCKMHIKIYGNLLFYWNKKERKTKAVIKIKKYFNGNGDTYILLDRQLQFM